MHRHTVIYKTEKENQIDKKRIHQVDLTYPKNSPM